MATAATATAAASATAPAALPKVDLQKEHDRLVSEIAPDKIAIFGGMYPELLTKLSISAVDNTKVIKTIPDSLARRVMTLFSVHFTVQNATSLPALFKMALNVYKDPRLFNYFKTIPGIEVTGAGYSDPTKQCDYHVFQHETWYPQVTENPTLLHGKKTVNFLQEQGYALLKAPQVGAVALYFEKGDAVHFGRVVEVKATGETVIESSFALFYVCRHSPEVVPRLFGTHFAYMMKQGKASAAAEDSKKAPGKSAD